MSSEPVYRAFIVIDVEDSSARANRAQVDLREALYKVVRGGLDASFGAARSYVMEDRGDGVMIVLDIALLEVVDPLLGKFIDALREHNGGVEPADWMRLRIGINSGLVHRDDEGWAGAALTTTFRLVDSRVVKEILKSATRAQCVVAVSNDVYEGVIRNEYRSINSAVYRPLESAEQDRAPRSWVMVPGYPLPPVGQLSPGPAADPQNDSPKIVPPIGQVHGDIRDNNFFRDVTARTFDASRHYTLERGDEDD